MRISSNEALVLYDSRSTWHIVRDAVDTADEAATEM